MFILSSLGECRLEGKKEEERRGEAEQQREEKHESGVCSEEEESEGNIFLTWMFLNLISKQRLLKGHSVSV